MQSQRYSLLLKMPSNSSSENHESSREPDSYISKKKTEIRYNLEDTKSAASHGSTTSTLSTSLRAQASASNEKIRQITRQREEARPAVVTLEIRTPNGPISKHARPKEGGVYKLPHHVEAALFRSSQISTESKEENTHPTGQSRSSLLLPAIFSSRRIFSEPSVRLPLKRYLQGNGEVRRALLRGYNRLHVFGEGRQPCGTQVKDVRVIEICAEHGKKYIPQCHSPVYKLDLRNYPTLPTNTTEKAAKFSSPEYVTTKGETTALSLSFKDGKMILSRSNSTISERKSSTDTVDYSFKINDLTVTSGNGTTKI